MLDGIAGTETKKKKKTETESEQQTNAIIEEGQEIIAV